jgi:hypothetical protein
VLAASVALALALAGGLSTPASAAVVDLPQPCPQLLNGDSSLAFFCRALNVTRQIANPRYERGYSLGKQLLIKRAVTALAARDAQFGPSFASLPAEQMAFTARYPRSGVSFASLSSQQLAFHFNLGGLRRFGVRALEVVRRVAGGIATVTPQGRVAKCALFGLLQGGGVAIAGGATVRQIAVATALGCIGGVVAPKA